MPRPIDHLETLTDRRLLLSSAVGLGFLGITARLVQLQGFEQAVFREAAKENQFKVQLRPARRGVIYDRAGIVLASNRRVFQVRVVPEAAGKRLPEIVRAVAGLLSPFPDGTPRLTETAIVSILEEAETARGFVPISIADDITWEDMVAIAVRAPELAGVETSIGEVRSYPNGPEFAHVIGYVARANRDEAGDDPVLRHPDIRIGKDGVEALAETALKGAHGATQVEVNAAGRIMSDREIVVTPADPGTDLILTLDAAVQAEALRAAGDKSAAIVVMDIVTGELLTLLSTPGFDPNDFVRGLSQRAFSALNQDEKRPLFNKTLAGTFPPGSTFKMATALAALDAGMAPEESVYCRGYLPFGSHTFHCWKRGGHGPMDMHRGIASSCDLYFYEAAQRAGPERIAKYARLLGLGARHFDRPDARAIRQRAAEAAAAGTPLPVHLTRTPLVDREGLVPDPDWKLRVRKEKWAAGETLNIGIGQGALLATPLQLAIMTARIASGLDVTPQLFRNGPLAPKQTPAPLPIPAEHLAIVRAGMEAVARAGGTAAVSANLGLPGIFMAGKTGTAQVRRITAAERARGVRANKDLPWALRDHALFVCYAPVDAPRYACSVVVEHGGGGSTDAAPIAREVMRLTLTRDPARSPAFQLNPTNAGLGRRA